MQFLDLTLSTMAENLALDEALLEEADRQLAGEEILRTWQAPAPCIVLGRSSRVAAEVDQTAAEQLSVPIYRRISGGATVVTGPGCMFYSLILSMEQRPALRMLDQAHECVMQHLAEALRPLLPAVGNDGICDLVIDNRKVSGNSLRVGRNWLLYHGTLLLEMDLQLVAKLLKHPPREPEYRAGREHADFVANCHVNYAEVSRALRLVWQATQPVPTIPLSRVATLVDQKYSLDSWNLMR